MLWLGVFMGGSALAAPDSKQSELTELRQRIQRLQEDLERTNATHNEASDALRGSERRISDINRALRDLERQQSGLTREIGQLNIEVREAETGIAEQQKRLAELLRQRYATGDNDGLRLLLNGQDPGTVARNLEHYGYVGRARQELIAEHRASLARLKTLRAQVREKHSSLTQIKRDREAQKRTLEGEKIARQEVIYRLSSQIRQQRRAIQTLEQDEKRLAGLIERLAKLAATRKLAKPPRGGNGGKTAQDSAHGEPTTRVADASLAKVAFTKLKGRLALPVAGEILHRFGQRRDTGGPPWRGLFIRAAQGQEVRAVATGQVAFSDWLRGFGNLLIIDHGGGYLSLYSNNESLYKQAGEAVRAGDVIAAVGASGGQDEPGLYFELRHDGTPFDPLAWVR